MYKSWKLKIVSKGILLINILSTRKQNRKSKFLRHFVLIIFLLIIYYTTSSAGWIDHPPVPVNSNANPGEVNTHGNSGGRRIVRVHGTTIVIVPHGSGEKTYRSSDNGNSWTEIDTDVSNSGCLVTGRSEMVYHFYRSEDNINMVKFRYNENPPAPVSIYTNADLSESNTGVYKAINAILDSEGNIFVACHWGNPDRLFLLRSYNDGNTWDGPYEISTGIGPWFYPHLEVTSDDVLVCTYDNFETHHIWFAKSFSKGESWERRLISAELTYNPSLLCINANQYFIFAQSGESAHTGLVFNYTLNGGSDWSGWILIDSTCGYAPTHLRDWEAMVKPFMWHTGAATVQVLHQAVAEIKVVQGRLCLLIQAKHGSLLIIFTMLSAQVPDHKFVTRPDGITEGHLNGYGCNMKTGDLIDPSIMISILM